MYGQPPMYGQPMPPLRDPTARRHDSFYLRLGFGVGYGHIKSAGTLSLSNIDLGTGTTTTSPIDAGATYSGWGPAYEVLIGGTPARGFVVGGGFVGQDVSNPTVTLTGNSGAAGTTTSTGTIGLGAIGPFVDWFPDEREGLHFGGMVGFAILGLTDDNNGSSSGIAGSLWGGYDFWVASQWSLGAEARVASVSASRTFRPSAQSIPLSSVPLNGTIDDSGTSAELLFTAVYH